MLQLIKAGSSAQQRAARMFRCPERLRDSYDVVIIGGGGHGLAAAYYLARDHGIHKVAVLEKGYLGGGSTGRNTAIIHSNAVTPQGVQFYARSVRLWQDLSRELDLNLCYSTRGHFTLAHCDASLRTLRWRAEVHKHYDVRCEIVDRNFIAAHLPMLDLECGGHRPVLAALYHEPGAIARHDAVAWGYARAADRLGVEIHQQTEVIGLEVKDGAIAGVRTTRGRIGTRNVLCAVAGHSPRILDLVGLRTPIYVRPLQAMVSEPMQRWLDPIVVSGSLHVHVSQSARGELVMGASLDPYELHQTRATLEFTESLATCLLDLFPALGEVKVLRQWAGLADMTPDFAPIMGTTPVAGFYLDAGWGTWGFTATPICGKTLSHTVATGRDHELIERFSLARYGRFESSGEQGAAAVAH